MSPIKVCLHLGGAEKPTYPFPVISPHQLESLLLWMRNEITWVKIGSCVRDLCFQLPIPHLGRMQRKGDVAEGLITNVE